jgi:hypothetical protein
MYGHYSGRRLWRREEKLTPTLTVISGVVGSFPAARGNKREISAATGKVMGV